MSAPTTIGVIGAGTMGAGIAQLGAQSGARTLLFDLDAEALERGAAGARAGIAKLVEKGRLQGDAEEIGARLETVSSMDDLAPCELIIEVAPERLELKHQIFEELSRIAPDAVLASNTSSIPITAIATAAADPSKVVGLHFFNPAPLMKLVELIAAVQSSPESLALARAAGEAMDRRVIDAADGPGFLVNRCNRPWGLEALRLLTDQIADVETIDRILRCAGFRMGPFELQDLVGIDVGFEVSKSFQQLSFGEPRWQPSPLSARMVAAGRLGRKTGHGWYVYEDGKALRDPDPPAPEVGGGDGLVVIAGELSLAYDLRELAVEAGWDVAAPDEAEGEVPYLLVDCGHDAGEGIALQGAPQTILVADSSLHQLDPGGGSSGFHALPTLEPGGMVELTRGSGTTDEAQARTEAFFASLGLHTVWVGDVPGLVLGRIICQIINESAFALQEGVTASPADVDDGMMLGMNQPRGPLAWADAIGLDHVLMVLDGLRAELGEERYRAAPLIRRMVSEGKLGVGTGEGFFSYEHDHDHDGHDHDH
jgi:3-hydroxybutyryl-CoA dehydrogenase